MTAEQIEKIVGNASGQVSVSFKTRNNVEGIFIRAADYTEMKGKNFWRIVTVKHLEDYKRSKDLNLSRIFNGAEFTKLSTK